METVNPQLGTALKNLLESNPIETAMEMKDLIFQTTLLMAQKGDLIEGNNSNHAGNLYKLNAFFDDIIANTSKTV